MGGFFLGLEVDANVSSFHLVQHGSVALFTLHTGFKDHTTPKDALFQESIELWALMFYD